MVRSREGYAGSYLNQEIFLRMMMRGPAFGNTVCTNWPTKWPVPLEEIELVATLDLMSDEVDYMTCYACLATDCEFRFDEYNTNGDCLEMK